MATNPPSDNGLRQQVATHEKEIERLRERLHSSDGILQAVVTTNELIRHAIDQLADQQDKFMVEVRNWKDAQVDQYQRDKDTHGREHQTQLAVVNDWRRDQSNQIVELRSGINMRTGGGIAGFLIALGYSITTDIGRWLGALK